MDDALRAEPREDAQVRVGNEDDVAPRPAVATVRAALRDVLLTPEAQRSGADATALHPDAGAVMEHTRCSSLVGNRDDAALAARLECDLAVALGEDRVVSAHARAGT